MTVDAAGNTYVTGYSDGIGTGKDYVTIKYNPLGTQQWAARYNGPGNAEDFANAIVLDTMGNIYVTGKSTGTVSLEDIATIKYNPGGTMLWTLRYNGNANNSDEGNTIAYDKLGNIIVSGKSKSASLNFDIITIKYNLSGAQQWVKILNGSNNSDDEASSVTTDNAGNVFVAGSCNNIVTNSDYTTIKYNYAGIEQWVCNYNGSMNNTDKASSICIDPAGNVYVAGFCQDIGTNMNFLTIRYNTGGALVWLDKFNHIDNDSDMAFIDNEILIFASGYNLADLTGDEIVDLSDMSIADNNSFEFITVIRP
ncbi:MAG: SBBP repeat-containing protein [Bacteroidota bacterium]|nr:SBBP repeat-containing protein [Bacteroidota bacterium]